MRVYIADAELKAIREKGGVAIDNFLLPTSRDGLCPFKDVHHLCTLHNTPHKPLGCIVSPFALNKNDTLIIRNRYKFLKCYDQEVGEPAYRTFRKSLIALFGIIEVNKLTTHLDNNGNDVTLPMDDHIYSVLKQREKQLHQAI